MARRAAEQLNEDLLDDVLIQLPVDEVRRDAARNLPQIAGNFVVQGFLGHRAAREATRNEFLDPVLFRIRILGTVRAHVTSWVICKRTQGGRRYR